LEDLMAKLVLVERKGILPKKSEKTKAQMKDAILEAYVRFRELVTVSLNLFI